MQPLLVFDLDGTLIDSAQDIANAVNKTLVRHGKSEVPYATVVSHIGEGLRALLVDFFPEHQGQTEILNKIEFEFLKTYEEEMLKETRIFPGVVEFLKSWQGPVGIITNKRIAPTKIIVEHLGLHHIPWVEVYGADTFAEKKPSPLPLFNMMKLAGKTADQTVMIGDGIPDMMSAQNAGVKSVAISFGYTQKEILQKYNPAGFLNHYSELKSVIQSLGFTV